RVRAVVAQAGPGFSDGMPPCVRRAPDGGDLQQATANHASHQNGCHPSGDCHSEAALFAGEKSAFWYRLYGPCHSERSKESAFLLEHRPFTFHWAPTVCRYAITSCRSLSLKVFCS